MNKDEALNKFAFMIEYRILAEKTISLTSNLVTLL